jgi:hypothetical protein
MPFSLARLLRGPAIRIEINDSPETQEDLPIPAEWIIEGEPRSRVGTLSKSADNFTTTFIWSCTKGRFHWHFEADETVHIMEGEVFVTDDDGTERRLSPGSVALFRAGSHSVWHVPEFVKKIAFIYNAPPMPVSLAVRALRKIHALMAGKDKKQGLAA